MSRRSQSSLLGGYPAITYSKATGQKEKSKKKKNQTKGNHCIQGQRIAWDTGNTPTMAQSWLLSRDRHLLKARATPFRLGTRFRCFGEGSRAEALRIRSGPTRELGELADESVRGSGISRGSKGGGRYKKNVTDRRCSSCQSSLADRICLSCS